MWNQCTEHLNLLSIAQIHLLEARKGKKKDNELTGA